MEHLVRTGLTRGRGGRADEVADAVSAVDVPRLPFLTIPLWCRSQQSSPQEFRKNVRNRFGFSAFSLWARTIISTADEQFVLKIVITVHSPLRQRPGMPSPEPLFFFIHALRKNP